VDCDTKRKFFDDRATFSVKFDKIPIDGGGLTKDPIDGIFVTLIPKKFPLDGSTYKQTLS
jgi:hypothetical protein